MSVPPTRVFVDTSGWYAMVDRDDRDHSDARAWLRENDAFLITTDYVLDETLTLLRRKLNHTIAVDVGRKMKESDLARIVSVGKADREAAWERFVQYDDESFSFTDCTSFAVMERLDVTDAFTFDRDFTIAGFRTKPNDQ